MLVFTALPNIFFGYDSAVTSDIVDFTASAHGLEAVYQSIEQKNRSVIDRLVESILPNFVAEDGPDYDDYEVEKSVGNVNHYWLIAIGSVRYKQDLNVMDEPTIEKLLSDKLTYTASITDRVLHISVRDLTPEAYMDKLGFTQEEKDWAALLYSVMADGQNVSPRGLLQSDGRPVGQQALRPHRHHRLGGLRPHRPGHGGGLHDRQQGNALRRGPVVRPERLPL